MRWWPTVCHAGDMIRVRIGSLWHYGIYVSDAEVIQFGLPPRGNPQPAGQIRVCTSTIAEFTGGEIVEVARLSLGERVRRIPAKKTIQMARERIGEGGYHVLNNNCEHFVTGCVFGKAHSLQSEAALKCAQGIYSEAAAENPQD